jgi:signal transduction histidine kinase
MGNTPTLLRLAPFAGALATLAALGYAWLIARTALALVPGVALLACGVAGIGVAFLIPLRAARNLRTQVVGMEQELRAKTVANQQAVDECAQARNEAAAALAAMRADAAELAELRASLAGRGLPAQTELEREPEVEQPEYDDDVIASVTDLARSLAARLGKFVTVRAEGFDTRTLSPDRRLAVKDVLIQLARNSVMHGIESADERAQAGKPRAGSIAILPTPALPAGSFGFTFRDDGRGLDVARIRERAVARGLLTGEAEAGADDAAVAALIFLPGFSTSDESAAGPGPALAGPGRGLGLHLIQRRVVDDCGGELTLDSHPGESCAFSFVLPDRAREMSGALTAIA